MTFLNDNKLKTLYKRQTGQWNYLIVLRLRMKVTKQPSVVMQQPDNLKQKFIGNSILTRYFMKISSQSWLKTCWRKEIYKREQWFGAPQDLVDSLSYNVWHLWMIFCRDHIWHVWVSAKYWSIVSCRDFSGNLKHEWTLGWTQKTAWLFFCLVQPHHLAVWSPRNCKQNNQEKVNSAVTYTTWTNFYVDDV